MLLTQMDSMRTGVGLFSVVVIGPVNCGMCIYQKLVPWFFYLHPLLYSFFAQGFILVRRSCIANENEASRTRNKMSLCSWLLVDIAFLFDFFFFFSPVTLLECCCRSWLSEQGWLNQWKDCGETCEVCRKHKHLRSFSVLKGWHAEIQNLFTS